MFTKSRPQIFPITRNMLIAATPLLFLVLLGIWTLFYISISSVKANPSPASAYAIVKRASANLREGPGFQYRVMGRSLKGATLTVIGKYDNEFGQRWYEVHLEALGNVWVSSTVVTISPSNALIPFVTISQGNTTLSTALPTEFSPIVPANGSTSSNSGNNNPPSNPQPQPTAAPGPATTPDPGA